MTTQEKIDMMRAAGLACRTSEIFQNANGTWSHHKDAACQWADRDACATDLRFCNEWAA